MPPPASACLRARLLVQVSVAEQLIDQELVAEHDLTGNPAAAAAWLRSHGVAGECAAMGGTTVLLECTRTICIGYGLIAGMG